MDRILPREVLSISPAAASCGASASNPNVIPGSIAITPAHACLGGKQPVERSPEPSELQIKQTVKDCLHEYGVLTQKKSGPYKYTPDVVKTKEKLIKESVKLKGKADWDYVEEKLNDKYPGKKFKAHNIQQFCSSQNIRFSD